MQRLLSSLHFRLLVSQSLSQARKNFRQRERMRYIVRKVKNRSTRKPRNRPIRRQPWATNRSWSHWRFFSLIQRSCSWISQQLVKVGVVRRKSTCICLSSYVIQNNDFKAFLSVIPHFHLRVYKVFLVANSMS